MESYKNVTTAEMVAENNEPQSPYFETYWLVSEAILVFLTLLTLYLFVCLLRYAVVTKCKPGREITRSKKGKILYQMCLMSVLMALGRLAADQVVAWYGWKSDNGCSVGVATSAVLYSLSLYPAYLFLWLRQNIFYSSPVLSHVLNPLISAVSWLTLVAMLFGGAIITALYAIPQINGWNYVASPTGCRDVSDLFGFELIPTMLVCFTVLFQTSLLCLFIYPLLSKSTRRYRRQGKPGKTSKQENSIASDANDVEFSNQCCSADHGEKTDKEEDSFIADVHFSAKLGNVSIRDSIISQNILPDTTTESNNKTNSLPQNGSICLNTSSLNKQDNTVLSKKEIKSNNKSSSGFFDLIKRPRTVSIYSKTSQCNSHKRKRSKTQQGRRIIKFIRKAFLLALVCVISDVLFTIIQLMLILPELVYLVLFDVNLLVNIICIIVSFRDWKHMVLPLCEMNSLNQTRSSSSSINVEKQRHQLSKSSKQTYRTKST